MARRSQVPQRERRRLALPRSAPIPEQLHQRLNSARRRNRRLTARGPSPLSQLEGRRLL